MQIRYWMVTLALLLIAANLLLAMLFDAIEEPGSGSSWARLQMYESDATVLMGLWLVTGIASIVVSLYAASWLGLIVAVMLYAAFHGGWFLIDRQKTRKTAPS